MISLLIGYLSRILVFLLLLAASPSSVWALTTSALKDQTCVGYRSGNTTCTAGEFTVSPVFSAAPGTPPFCVAGDYFNFQVELGLAGSNTDRMDVGFFVGQQGNDPRDQTPGNICSVATFPTNPLPWLDNDGDSCGDFIGGGVQTTTVNEIKVVCAGDAATGALTIPYVLTYWQNNGNSCTGPADVQNGSPSKCNAGTSAVSGVVAVRVGAYVDVTKATLPAGNTSQAFTYTATGPTGSKVVAQVGTAYTPAQISAATNTVTVSITGGQTVRFYIDATASNKTLTITEAATPGWESTANAISCSAVKGSPAITANPATRTITAANLTIANSAAACTFTNKQSARITLAKAVGGRVDSADQFSVSASGGGTLVGTTSATTSGTGTGASTTFYSSPSAALTLTDAKAGGPTALTGYDARLTCANAYTGAGATPNASLPNNLSTTSASITPAAGDDITCTFINTRKAAHLTLQTTWVNAAVNDAASVSATGLTALSSVANAANETDTGTAQSVHAGDMITLAEAFGPDNAARYASALSCTGTAGLSGNTVIIGPTDTDVICTYANTKIEAVIAGSVFKDSGTAGGTANNAIQDGAEAGISGVTVRLTDCNSMIYGTATTNGAGSYRFLASGVPEGSVCVEESNLSAYASTGINVEGSTAPPGYTLATTDKLSFSLANGVSHVGLNFGDVPANQFITDGNKTGIAGSTLIYPHTFIAGTGGSVTFSLPGAVASPNIPGWSEVLYLDADCDAQLDAAETSSLLLPTALTVSEGQTLCLIQKEFIPAGAAQGASNYAPVQASFAYVGSSLPDAVYTRQDVTTVGSSALLLHKEVRNVSTPTMPAWQTRNTAKPGEILEYRITYTNNGPDPITNLQINDATPAFTTFVSGLCESAVPATPTSLGVCTLTQMPPPQQAGALKWTFSSTGSPSQLPPAGTGFVTFQVKVD